MRPRLRRHDLAYLRDGAAVQLATSDAAAEEWIGGWIGNGMPLVVTRQDEQRGPIRLGAVLPLRLGRRRVNCNVTGDDVVDTAPPLSVEAIIDRLAPDSAPALEALAARAQELGVAVGVYGSTAWEHLARETYRHAESDIDLVCDVARRSALAPWLAVLERASNASALRIDGEIRFPDGRAVAWRELARCGLDPDAKVLAKDLTQVALTRIGSLMESFA